MAYISPEVDHDFTPVQHGMYEHMKITCQEALTSTAGVSSSGQTLTFQILGSNVCNLAKSYLEFDIEVPAQAASYIWLMAGCIPFFRSVAFQPVGGSQLYIDMYHHYSKMSMPYLIPAEELKTLDNANMFFPSRTLQAQNKLPANGFNSAVPYDEMQYAIQIASAVGAAGSWHVQIPFSLFAGTILSMNSDHYFGQAVNIQFTLEDYNKWIWVGTSAIDPSIGAAALITTTAAFKLSSIYLQLAVEQDPLQKKICMDRYLTGYRCYVPNVQKLYQQNLNGTSQSINTPIINRGYGAYLQRIFTSPFNNTETLNTSLDNCNQAASPITTSATNHVITFQTLLDSNPRQQTYITAAPQVQGAAAVANNGGIGDWNRYKSYLAGSSLLCSGTLGLNWTYVDDWTSPESRIKKALSDGNKIEGLDLSLGDHTWQFLSTNATANYNWYVYVQSLKVMEVGPGKLTIV